MSWSRKATGTPAELEAALKGWPAQVAENDEAVLTEKTDGPLAQLQQLQVAEIVSSLTNVVTVFKDDIVLEVEASGHADPNGSGNARFSYRVVG